MKTFHYFAARDGETATGTVQALDEEAARVQARIDIAKEFGMVAELEDAALNGAGAMDEFDAELDGFTVEELP